MVSGSPSQKRRKRRAVADRAERVGDLGDAVPVRLLLERVDRRRDERRELLNVVLLALCVHE